MIAVLTVPSALKERLPEERLWDPSVLCDAWDSPLCMPIPTLHLAVGAEGDHVSHPSSRLRGVRSVPSASKFFLLKFHGKSNFLQPLENLFSDVLQLASGSHNGLTFSSVTQNLDDEIGTCGWD